MDDLLSEKEQIEQMRAWWSEYGRYVIAGVVIAVGLLFGFNQYNKSKLEAQIAASELYEALAVHVSDGDAEAAEAAARELAANYGNTSYAAQAKLAMARLYMDKNRDEDAAGALRELLALRGNAELKLVGKLRLARILLYQDKAEAVVELVAGHDSPAFAALFDEVLGDAYAALGRYEEAGQAYRAALSEQGQAPTIDRRLVQMKLADLPDPAAASAAPVVPVAGAENGEATAGEGPADAAAAEPDETGTEQDREE
ncbi:MAG: tetratricopeptide repeat protein [Woeseiaceae bacterium]|nr:tetratricopeptide repeat protein [Woeseiaceae bacterium]